MDDFFDAIFDGITMTTTKALTTLTNGFFSKSQGVKCKAPHGEQETVQQRDQVDHARGNWSWVFYFRKEFVTIVY